MSNKYLDALGLKEKDYNFNADPDFEKDKRQKLWQEQRKDYGFDERITWALSDFQICNLYTQLQMYKELASEVVDLTFHKFTYKDKEYTQIEAIDHILNACEYFIRVTYNLGEYSVDGDKWSGELESEAYEKMKDALHLYAEIWPAMWW